MAVVASVTTATTVKGTIDLIIDPGTATPGNGALAADVKSALAQCFTYDVKSKSGQACSAGALAGITVTTSTPAANDPAWMEAYKAWYGCEECEELMKDGTLQIRRLGFSISSSFVHESRAKSVGQNSDMMTEGLLELTQAASTKRAGNAYAGKVLEYSISTIEDATESEECAQPLAIGNDPQEESNLESTNDWRKTPHNNSLTAAETFGVVVGSLAGIGALVVIAVLVRRRLTGGDASGSFGGVNSMA